LWRATCLSSPLALKEVEEWFGTLGAEASSVCSATRLRSWCVPATVKLPDKSDLLVLSIHNPAYPIARPLLVGRDISAIKLKLHPDLWLLDVLFYFLKHRLSSPLLVGGDFNYSRLLDDPTPRGNNEFFDRIAKERFVSLHRLFCGVDEQTFFHPKRRKHQLDYLYADLEISALATECRVVARSEVERFSDHVPLVAELKCETLLGAAAQ
jgi:hypothetical protein